MSRDHEADFAYIRRVYKVPARYGQRVKYFGDPTCPKGRGGVVQGADGARVLIRLDGDNEYARPFHPTWKLEYDQPASPPPPVLGVRGAAFDAGG